MFSSLRSQNRKDGQFVFFSTDYNFPGSYSNDVPIGSTNVNFHAQSDDTSYCTVSRVYHLNNKLVETEMTTMEWHRICYI